jgi:hypothetical protein
VSHTPTTTPKLRRALLAVATATLLVCGTSAAAETTEMPLGAFLCKSIDPVIEHAKIVRAPSSTGLREFVEGKVASGECRMIKTEGVKATVVGVDQRGFVLVEEQGQSGKWWTDAENAWGYFEAPKKLKEWKQP